MSAVTEADGHRSAPAYEAIARDLMALGVETAFGLMGDDTAKLVSTLRGLGVTYHGARHENTAIAMAQGYASVTGRLGVAIISRGPGLTNGLTAAVDAARARARVLIILGDGPTRLDPNRATGPEYKRFDGSGVAEASGLRAFVPHSAAAVRIAFREAASAALSGDTATLNIPIDLVDAAVDIASQPPPAPSAPPRPAAPEAVAVAVEALGESRRPLILAGAGAHRSGARDALVALAERTGALLGTSLRAKDLFRGHPLDIGIVGTQSHAAARDLAAQADTVLAFGAALTQFTTGLGETFRLARIVHVDAVRSNIGRYCRADVAVVGDARLVAEQLLEAAQPPDDAVHPFHADETLRRLAEFEPLDWFEPATSAWTIDPRSLVTELDRVLPDARMVACDVGNFFGFIGPHLSVPGPDHFQYCFDFSAIGLGMGLGLGVAAGRPDLPTVVFVGDGALLMALGELETVVRCDIPVVVVVMNDAAYGAERHYLELHGMSGSSAVYPDVDFAELAQAFGITTATVRSAEEVRALAPLLAQPDGPILIDCKVTPTVRDPVFDELTAAASAPRAQDEPDVVRST